VQLITAATNNSSIGSPDQHNGLGYITNWPLSNNTG